MCESAYSLILLISLYQKKCNTSPLFDFQTAGVWEAVALCTAHNGEQVAWGRTKLRAISKIPHLSVSTPKEDNLRFGEVLVGKSAEVTFSIRNHAPVIDCTPQI